MWAVIVIIIIMIIMIIVTNSQAWRVRGQADKGRRVDGAMGKSKRQTRDRREAARCFRKSVLEGERSMEYRGREDRLADRSTGQSLRWADQGLERRGSSRAPG